jgi:hypothetical protein
MAGSRAGAKVAAASVKNGHRVTNVRMCYCGPRRTTNPRSTPFEATTEVDPNAVPH